jgi:hypothetical protein
MDRVPSSVSTSGAGTHFEHLAAGAVLAAMLRGDRVPGLDIPVTEVRFQQRAFGSTLDDFVAYAARPNQAPLAVEFQAKRTVRPTPGDKSWKAVVRQCIEALAAHGLEIDREERRLGLVAHGVTEPLLEMHQLCEWARSLRLTDNFMELLSKPGAVGGHVRERWAALCDTVHEVMESEGAPLDASVVACTAFRIAKALHEVRV